MMTERILAWIYMWVDKLYLFTPNSEDIRVSCQKNIYYSLRLKHFDELVETTAQPNTVYVYIISVGVWA